MDLYNYNGEKISNSLYGKKLSILGDSISTYNGYIPSGYDNFYPSGDVDNVNKTWWMSLINKSVYWHTNQFVISSYYVYNVKNYVFEVSYE